MLILRGALVSLDCVSLRVAHLPRYLNDLRKRSEVQQHVDIVRIELEFSVDVNLEKAPANIIGVCLQGPSTCHSSLEMM